MGLNNSYNCYRKADACFLSMLRSPSISSNLYFDVVITALSSCPALAPEFALCAGSSLLRGNITLTCIIGTRWYKPLLRLRFGCRQSCRAHVGSPDCVHSGNMGSGLEMAAQADAQDPWCHFACHIVLRAELASDVFPVRMHADN